MNLNDWQKHPSLLYAQELKALCKPLEYLDISTFSHLRVYKNNRLTVLCNRPDFLLNYAQKKYFDADPCVNINPEPIDFGEYLVWDAVNCQGKTAEMMQDAAAFDFRHVFTIIKQQEEFSDFYHFGTHLNDPAIHQIYINNLDLLDNFIHFFNRQINQSNTLSTAYDLVINPEQKPAKTAITTKQALLTDTADKRKNFLRATAGRSQSKLTSKEIDCASLLLKGKTAKEIAVLTGVSFRTIEDRIESLKDKFHVQNKTELILKLLGR
ncbi:transcriptional regulator EpsA [Legionella massiliensis]|uniref:Transcriptional regulator EpsA n=1 Tax=Legionella massiliensis TaxID=1034943 RepID=A0A078KU51_9GAMM|nr:helix-turn-helix transcriptional regulator [Legionella massiliensis]CDZ76566.1 transcriptional regulator EpsA [Legionella massiliensis]CEE12304.1 Bacterial regulatory proteins, luxR family [Legionella massiliensis]